MNLYKFFNKPQLLYKYNQRDKIADNIIYDAIEKFDTVEMDDIEKEDLYFSTVASTEDFGVDTNTISRWVRQLNQAYDDSIRM